MYMGTMTITVQDDVEEQFRQTAIQLYGQRKGALGEAVTDAMNDWVNKENATKTLVKLMEKGFHIGKWSKNRSAWHER